MHKLNDFLAGIEIYLGGSNWFTLLLLFTGIFFTIYLKFPQIRFFKHALKVVRGKYDKPGEKGDASHFQALATALSGTVGTGNIAGVAFAIYLGGPAALFWMLVTAFLGMTTKFVEVTLSHKYRETDEKGFISGGPMYYMKNKLKMPWLAGFFAAMTIVSSFGTGSLPQINSISSSLYSTFGFDQMITGGVLAVLLAFVILGGIKRIVKVTDKLVPAMAIIYFVGAISVILYNYENIIPSLVSVFANVFTGTAATGGFLGAGFAYAFNRGVNRGLFSNEAGQGSAPIAHAAARTEEPVSEGMVAILEPFIDTIVICSLTGLVILSSGVWKEKLSNRFQNTDMVIMADQYNDSNKKDQDKLFNFLNGKTDLPVFSGELQVKNGIIQNPVSIINSRSLAEEVKVYKNDEELYSGTLPIENGKYVNENGEYFQGNSLVHSAPLTAEAFTRSYFGEWGKWIVSLGLLLFAFSTAIAWAYYGGRSVTYLFGAKGVLPYRIIYCIGFFIASFADTTVIWTLSGITIALMALPNLIGILLLRKDMKGTMNNYLDKFSKEHPGEI
ncbi:amino acid carrier protein [Labilibaculum sp. A4]|uniref:alanine/glycine:cation symporter family protein n=1 Tax=Labilibaculum euxinus TaxID=2686357 RepID=UPI000F617834|nr:sodium:alanine symporter family protein [Labilibaculum euxinus]MDQ1770840.1 sodium:alanine symporter family protein [Labilibaculum euxinus]MWN76010.1 amino acid carrier protein [Labilibaculum euxinus]